MQVRKIGFGDVSVSKLEKGTVLKPNGTVPLPRLNREVVNVLDLPDGRRQIEVKYPKSSDIFRQTFNMNDILKGFDILSEAKKAAKKLAKRVTH